VRFPKASIPYAYLLLGPSAIYALGYALNALVMAANHNQMPVLVPGACPDDMVSMIHSCMQSSTHLKFLGDWIVTGSSSRFGIASPGDFMLDAGTATFWPGVVSWVALVLKRLSSQVD